MCFLGFVFFAFAACDVCVVLEVSLPLVKGKDLAVCEEGSVLVALLGGGQKKDCVSRREFPDLIVRKVDVILIWIVEK